MILIPRSFNRFASQVRQQKDRVKTAVERRRQQGPFRGHLEGLDATSTVRGWVVGRKTGKGNIPVALYAGDVLLEAGNANIARQDVRDTIGSDVHCGFEFTLKDEAFEHIRAAQGRVSLHTMQGETRYLIGEIVIPASTGDQDPSRNTIAMCAHVVKDDLIALVKLLDSVPEPAGEGLPPVVQPPLVPHARMFDLDPLIPDVPETSHPAYLDFTRYRFNLASQFDVRTERDSGDQFLAWYLQSYRSGFRVPLNADLINYLNEPVSMGSDRFKASRIMWWRLMGRRDIIANTNFNDHYSYLMLLFWWANHGAVDIHVEDCLVPDRFADILRGIHPSRRLDSYPLTYFSERFFLATPSLHFLQVGTAEGRKALLLVMLLMSVRRPDFLRYLARRDVQRLLSRGESGLSILNSS